MVRVIRMIIFTKKLITMTRLMMSVAISFMVMITMMMKKVIIMITLKQFLVAKKTGCVKKRGVKKLDAVA